MFFERKLEPHIHIYGPIAIDSPLCYYEHDSSKIILLLMKPISCRYVIFRTTNNIGTLKWTQFFYLENTYESRMMAQKLLMSILFLAIETTFSFGNFSGSLDSFGRISFPKTQKIRKKNFRPRFHFPKNQPPPSLCLVHVPNKNASLSPYPIFENEYLTSYRGFLNIFREI